MLNINGIGYSVSIPLSSYDRLPAKGDSCRLLIYHHITESDERLFGFISENERIMFTRLLAISGVGPKLAITALSGLPVKDFEQAVSSGNTSVISSISGIGKKTAERIVVELKDVFSNIESLQINSGSESSNADNRLHDAALALNALGHSADASTKMVKSILPQLTSSMTVEEIIRLALKK